MWLRIPKTSYHYTQEEEDSTSDLDWLFPMLEQSVMSREKFRQSQFWSKAWKRESWMTHLFGQIPQPSMAALGLEKWIGSLEDSHANHGQSQEKEKAQKTKDGFGMTSSKSLCRYNPQDSSWRMFQVSLLDMELTPYLETFPKWGSMRNGEVLKQETSELPTGENVYSYWRTSQASDGEGGTKEMREGVNSRYKLRDHSANVVANWMTPNTMDSMPPKSKEAMDKHYQGVRKGRTQPSNLREQIIPQLHNKDWKTPTTHDFIEHNQMELNEKGRRLTKNKEDSHSVGLGDQVKITNWMTPMANDHKYRFNGNTQSSNNLEIQSRKKSTLQHSHQDQTQKNGNQYSEITQDSPQPWKNLRLNPMFVEWLMGWPLGYTELTDLEYSEMESYHFKQLTHLKHLLKQ